MNDSRMEKIFNYPALKYEDEKVKIDETFLWQKNFEWPQKPNETEIKAKFKADHHNYYELHEDSINPISKRLISPKGRTFNQLARKFPRETYDELQRQLERNIKEEWDKYYKEKDKKENEYMMNYEREGVKHQQQLVEKRQEHKRMVELIIERNRKLETKEKLIDTIKNCINNFPDGKIYKFKGIQFQKPEILNDTHLKCKKEFFKIETSYSALYECGNCSNWFELGGISKSTGGCGEECTETKTTYKCKACNLELNEYDYKRKSVIKHYYFEFSDFFSNSDFSELENL